ncbi:MAG: FHA domain-containing protein [Acidimicrobiia bacterium]
MSEALLTLLKFCFLALLFLFLARVVRVVVMELRAPALSAEPSSSPAPATARRGDGRGTLRLRVIDPAERRGQTIDVGDEVTVGRAGGCGIVLDDDTYVSQLHARLFRQQNDTFVEDLGSTNGTFLNGSPVSVATRLRKGDRVQFGQTVCEVIR